MKDVYVKNNNFYKEIKKYLKSKDICLHFYYDKKDIIDDTYIKDKYNWDIKFKIYSIHAVNIKNIKERYSYIYDVVCDYLDEEFNYKNICGFENNICLSVKNNGHCHESKNGCCYGRNRGLCKNFINGKCQIKSISCKLFTCRYLKKQNIRYKVNDIPLLRYFFNIKQKYIIDTSIFKGKEEIIKLLIKNK